MLLDLLEVDGLAEAGGLEEVAGVAPERRHLGQPVAVALEVAVVDGVEARQGGEQPHVGLGDRPAHQVAAVGEALFEPVHRGPQPVVGLVVGLLRAGEAAAVDTVVDLGEDPLHHLVHLLADVVGPQVGRVGAVVVAPLEEEVVGDPGEVVGHDLAGGLLDDRRHRDAARVVGVAGEVGLLQPLDPQHRVDAPGVEVEGPAALVVGGATQALGDDVLQPEELAHDDRAVGPRAGPRSDQAVAPRLDRPLGRVGVGLRVPDDAVRDVVHVAVEALALLDIGPLLLRLSARLVRHAPIVPDPTVFNDPGPARRPRPRAPGRCPPAPRC